VSTPTSGRWPHPRRPRDGGSATVLALIAAAVVAAAVALLASVTLLLYVQHRVSSAADLAALAGAAHLTEGASVVCTVAADLARANHAELLSCRPDVSSVTVSVRLIVTDAWWSTWVEQIVGYARAGYTPSVP
jgi:secretion/DNA translocation related TadE-like protein